jgi:HSP20 family protein
MLTHQPRPVMEPISQLTSLLNDPIFRDWTPAAFTKLPAVDIEENDQNYVIKADVPGFEKDQVHVEVQANSLIISGRNEKETEKTENQVYSRERSLSDFKRTITLPENINKEEIKAAMKNGVLTLNVAKHRESKQQIDIE